MLLSIAEYIRYLIIESFKNFFSNFRISYNADKNETIERGRGKEEYITRYTI